MRLGAQLNAKVRSKEAIKGFVLTKLDSVKRRLTKYYGMRWYDLVQERSAISVAIKEFIRNAIIQGIMDIVSEYADLEEVEDLTPEAVESAREIANEPIEALEHTKANYMHAKSPKAKTHQINSGEFGLPE